MVRVEQIHIYTPEVVEAIDNMQPDINLQPTLVRATEPIADLVERYNEIYSAGVITAAIMKWCQASVHKEWSDIEEVYGETVSEFLEELETEVAIREDEEYVVDMQMRLGEVQDEIDEEVGAGYGLWGILLANQVLLHTEWADTIKMLHMVRSMR